jgi:hypothetical protein
MAARQAALMQPGVLPDWYQVDHGYWRRGEYYRISHKRLWCDGRGQPDFARLDLLGVNVAPTRTGGRHVLVAMQSPGFYQLWAGTSPVCFSERITKKVRQHTDRPIVFRQKPNRWGRLQPIEVALRDAWLVITHSSAVALDALAAGVPVIVTEATFCAARLGTLWEQIENPYRPTQDERRDLFARIAGHQWTLAEMRSGEVWERLKP